MRSLYSLLPEIIRIRDGQAVLAVGEEGVLKRIIDAFQNEAEITKDEIDGLAELQSPQDCPVEFLPLLAKLLGIRYSATWSEEKRRLFVLAAGLIWKAKGTQESWKALLQANGYLNYFPWELWKSKIYEDTDYSLEQDYGHPYKAARVDIRRPTDITGDSGRLDCNEVVEPARAAHILIRRPAQYVGGDEAEKFDVPADTEYDGTSLVSLCSMSRLVDDMGWDDGDVFLPGEMGSGEVGLEVSIYCSGWSCQASCTGSCTGACQAIFGCQSGPCQTSCMTACILGCQTGACETDVQP